MQIATTIESLAVISEVDFQEFRRKIGGSILLPGDGGYDQARVIFNGMFDRRPALIVRCHSSSDVSETVQFAKERHLLLAVRGGGHSVAGDSMCDQGLVIDLSGMHSVVIDREKRAATVQGGATWADVDQASQVFGLATPGGIVSHTGVAGLTLGGGIGWLRNKYGLSCDNLISAEMVTADGRIRTVSTKSGSDLFWAIRGAGGGFGVVTSFEFALHPVGPPVAAVFTMYPLTSARRVLHRWREWVGSSPPEAATEIVAWTAPCAPGMPSAVHGREVIIAAGAYVGDPQEGMRVLQPLREFDSPLGETASVMPYLDLQRAFDRFFPNTGEIIAYWKSLYLDDLNDSAIEIMADRAENRSAPETMVFVQHLGSAVRSVCPEATAFRLRNAAFVVNFMGNWREPQETPRHVAWIRQAWDRLAPHSTGSVYLNYLGHEDREADTLVRSAFGSNYDRLAAIKAEYDPSNVFRATRIKPALASRFRPIH